MDALMLDGNAVAGLLQEVFAVEMTTAITTCRNCGATEAVGALHVFRGAGIVMRCPHCDTPSPRSSKRAHASGSASQESARCRSPSSGARRKEVNRVDGHAGNFSLATPVEGNPAGTLVQVTVSAVHRSRLVLDFRDHHRVLTNASVLLCGHIGALELLELGYTGPLVKRPRLAAFARSKASPRR